VGQEIIDDFPRLLWLLQPRHVPTFADKRERRIFDQRMRFTNVRFSGQILPPLKEKNRSEDGFEFRPDVILPLGLQKRWRNAEIVILGIEFRRHLQRLLSVVEVSGSRRT
jgi:hypothetical protein